MSRADKTQSAITYELLLDDNDAQLKSLKMTVLCASRPDNPEAAKLGPYVRKHVAFMLEYRFNRHDQLEPLQPPADVQKLLR